MNGSDRDNELDKLLEELKQKRDQPDALRFATDEYAALQPKPPVKAEDESDWFVPRMPEQPKPAPERSKSVTSTFSKVTFPTDGFADTTELPVLQSPNTSPQPMWSMPQSTPPASQIPPQLQWLAPQEELSPSPSSLQQLPRWTPPKEDLFSKAVSQPTQQPSKPNEPALAHMPQPASPAKPVMPAQQDLLAPAEEKALPETIQAEAQNKEPKEKQEEKIKKKRKNRNTFTTTASISRREIISALNAGEGLDENEEDPINKNMLAPTIERGIDIEVDEVVIDVAPEEKETPEMVDNAEYVENHPLFTQSITRQTIIPKEKKRQPDDQQPFRAPQFETSEIIKDDYSKRIEKKGVLNVRENLDDNFREFFGDSVIIDRQTLGEKSQKQRRIKDFVLPKNDDEIGMPVFEDDVEQPEPERVSEYRSEADTEPILTELMKHRGKNAFRTIFTGIFALLMMGLALLAHFNMAPEMISEPTVFYVMQAVLLLLVVCFNVKQVFGGFIKLLTFKADGESVAGLAVILSLAESVLLITSADEAITGSYGCIAALALFFINIGSLMTARRVLKSFQFVADAYDKYATAVLADQKFTRRITRELDIHSPSVLIKRKTGFTNNFMTHAFSDDSYGRKVSVCCSLAIFVTIGCGVAAYLFTQDITGALRTACAAAILCTPFAGTIASALPIFRMHSQLSKVGAVVPGYSAAEEICSANCVVVEGRELFPRGNVKLHGIKTFERERIDNAILYAASVLIQSCDTMAHMFMTVLLNKTELLHEVDSVEYEAGLGYSFWIGKSRMLLGTRELLAAHDIAVPSRDYEARYTKKSSRDAMYLAVAGKLYAMFVISYAPDMEVREALRGFVREGICILMHTRDFNVTAERIAKTYKVPQTMVNIVRESDAEELTQKTEYVSHAPSALTHIGTLTSLVKGVTASYAVRSAAKTSSTIELIGLILGMLLAIALTVVGSLLSLGMLPVLLFQLIWCGLLCIMVSLYRY